MAKLNFKNLSLRNKILLPLITVAVLTGGLTYLYFTYLYKETLISERIGQARALVLSAESVREYVADQQNSDLFVKDVKDIEKVLKTVPIFAAIKTASAKAKELNFGFKVPKFSPRNPENEPDEYEANVLKILENGNKEEYFEIDEATQKIRYFRPVRLTAECLKCHGDPKRSTEYWGRTDGKDLTGTKMEGWEIGQVHGSFEVMVDMQPIQASVSGKSLIIALISAASVIIITLLGIILSRKITLPILIIKERMSYLEKNCIKNLNDGLKSLAIGDLSKSVDKKTLLLNLSQEDEVGKIAESFDLMVTQTQSAVDSYNTVRDKLSEATNELQIIINQATAGDLNYRGDSNKFEGTYGKLVQSTNDLLDIVVIPIKEGIEVLEIMSGGDFTARVKYELGGEYKALKESINKLGESVCYALTEVLSATEATASASAQISSSAEEMAAGAQEQSAQSSEIASAIAQMTKTIMETTGNTAAAADTSKQAGDKALLGSSVISETVQGMKTIADVVKNAAVTVQELGSSSEQIGTIVQVINDIADQTNLLALNAAIEAARAGEQGRGFAVVADEVRKLAERTTKATQEISDMIKRIQKDTGDAVKSMELGTREVENGLQLTEKSGNSLSQIVDSVAKVDNIIGQVAAASEEQSSAAEQIGRSVEGINNVTQQTAAGIQQIARAAEDLNNLTVNLYTLIERFKISNKQAEKSIIAAKSPKGNYQLGSFRN
jgi:methyl-accepting chemotaxis protein